MSGPLQSERIVVFWGDDKMVGKEVFEGRDGVLLYDMMLSIDDEGDSS